MNTCEVWVVESERKVLVTEYPGPPGAICGYVSDEATQAAEQRGYATVSEIGFPADAYLGQFDTPIFGWGKAGEVAIAKTKELGFTVEYQPMISDLEEDDEDWDYQD